MRKYEKKKEKDKGKEAKDVIWCDFLTKRDSQKSNRQAWTSQTARTKQNNNKT